MSALQIMPGAPDDMTVIQCTEHGLGPSLFVIHTETGHVLRKTTFAHEKVHEKVRVQALDCYDDMMLLSYGAATVVTRPKRPDDGQGHHRERSGKRDHKKKREEERERRQRENRGKGKFEGGQKTHGFGLGH